MLQYSTHWPCHLSQAHFKHLQVSLLMHSVDEYPSAVHFLFSVWLLHLQRSSMLLLCVIYVLSFLLCCFILHSERVSMAWETVANVVWQDPPWHLISWESALFFLVCSRGSWRSTRMEMGEGASPERKQQKTARPPNCLFCKSDGRIDSSSLWEIPIILKALVSTTSSWANCGAGVPAQRGEQYFIKLRMKVL